MGEHDAPILLIFQEIFKPMILVVLGMVKYKVPVDEVADRASIDFVLLLVLYEASDVGLPGVFDLLDWYTHFCLFLLWLSALETFYAEEFFGADGDDLSTASDMDFLILLQYLFVLGNVVFGAAVYYFKSDSGDASSLCSGVGRVTPTSSDGGADASPRVITALTHASSTSGEAAPPPQQQLYNLSPSALTMQRRGSDRPLGVIHSE